MSKFKIMSDSEVSFSEDSTHEDELKPEDRYNLVEKDIKGLLDKANDRVKECMKTGSGGIVKSKIRISQKINKDL